MLHFVWGEQKQGTWFGSLNIRYINLGHMLFDWHVGLYMIQLWFVNCWASQTKFELGIEIGKNLDNGIYEFWKWNWNWEKCLKNQIHKFWTWNWCINDLTSKWYVMDLTHNYCLSMYTHFESMARKWDLWIFNFGIAKLGI